MIRCEGKCAPVRGCDCPWCRVSYGIVWPKVEDDRPRNAPTGDFLEEDNDGD